MDWITDTKTLLVAGVVVILSYLFFGRRKNNLPPGPTPLPLIGNLLTFAWNSSRSFEVLTQLSKKYGDIYTIYIGMSKTVVLNSVESIREAIVTKQNDFAGRPNLFSVNIMTENGKDIAFGQFTSVWQTHRKIVHSAIRNYASGKNLEERVLKCVDITTQQMKSEKTPFNPKSHITLLVYNIICGTAFGRVYEIDHPEFKFLTQLMDKDILEAFGSGLPEDFVPFIQYIYTPSKTKKLKKVIKEYLDFLTTVWDQHKENYDPDNLQDLADFLIHTQRSMMDTEDKELVAGITDRYMIQSLSDFFNAGTDTSRYTLFWVVAFLAEHPDVQKKMQQQIDDVCGSRQVNLADRTKLPYVDAVLFEAMRIGSVAPNAVPHRTTCDTSVGGYDIPKDTMVLVNIHALHYDADFWEDHEQFKPERFLEADGSLLPKPSHFLPFSAGRRVCVGEILAKHELHLIIASLYQRHNIVSPPGEEVKAEMSDFNFGCLVKDFKVVVSQRD